MKIDIDDNVQEDCDDSLDAASAPTSAGNGDGPSAGDVPEEESDDEPEHGSVDKSGSWLRRYVSLLTVGVMTAIVYMLFFSDTSVLHKIEYQRIIDSLQTEVEINRDSMLYYKELNSRLSSDPEVMERVVREQHNMKRPDEDVYVFSAE